MRIPGSGRPPISRPPARAIPVRPETRRSRPSTRRPTRRPRHHSKTSPAAGSHAESPTSEPPAGIIAAIGQIHSRLDQRLETLQALFEREIRAEATRERIVDRLHAELQEYKQDLLLKVQRPIFIDLIQLHDDIGKMIDAQPAEDPDRAASVPRARSTRSAPPSRTSCTARVLSRSAWRARNSTLADSVPSARCRPRIPERNKTIAVRLRPGFQAGDKLIRPEIVSVHTLKK